MKIWWVYLDIGTGNHRHYNHGVGQIDACLRQAGHTSEMLYLRETMNHDDFRAALRRAAPDAVLFPVNTHQFVDAPQYAAWVKEVSNVPVVFGGIHAILDPESIAALLQVDAICVGEGEKAMVEWCAAQERGAIPSGIQNMWLRRMDGSFEKNSLRPLIEELDALPIDERDMWDHTAILHDSCWEIGIMGGRGCPFDCAYCANSARRQAYRGLGKFVRMCSPEKLIEMVAVLERRIPFRKIFFEDDVFTMDHDWVRRFCELYRARFRYPFRVYIHVQTVTHEILQTLKDTGCYQVMAGVEAGNETLRREVLGRAMNNDELIRAFRWCDEIGLQTWTFNMVGFPGETEDTIRNLLELHRALRPNGAQCSLFYPYPGTRLHQRCVEEKLFGGEARPTYFEKSILRLPTITTERLEEVFWEFRRETLRLKAEKERRGIFDFSAELPTALVEESHSAEPPRLHLTKIDGDERLGIFAHPRCRLTWAIEPPPGAQLWGAIALDPLCLYWGGKGARFQIEAENKLLFSLYLDPKEIAGDRRWQEITVDLSRFSGRKISLSLITLPHPCGDLTGAWAVWSELRIEIPPENAPDNRPLID